MAHAHAAASAGGLTFIELACVLAILGVLAALAVPSMQSFMQAQRLRSAASELAADLRYMRSEGLALNQSLRLRLRNGADGDCYVLHTGPADACGCAANGGARCDDGARALRSAHWPATDRVRLQSKVAALLFDPLHGTVTPAATLRVVGANGAAIEHVVNIVGRVRSCAAGARVAGVPSC